MAHFKIENLSFSYPTAKGKESLHDVSLTIHKGEYVVLCGKSGSGKTTLLNIIRDRGGLVLDCDAIYHELLRRDTHMLEAIEARFPGTVRDGALDRKKLGAIVFADPQALERLNRLTASYLQAAIEAELSQAQRLCAIDAIRLLESGLGKLCNTTVAVTAPAALRVARLTSRDGITEAYAKSRIAAQPSDGWYAQNCDHLLENNGTLEEFQGKCLAFLESLDIM